ncbi:unnamed protein product [Darwinula stevensoni]|uniref:Uncharacterized protein n=1 Tax=Darwinula stevensoni TaxID=69355 RepID=A0A7R8XJZ9_9CRUS|nr:unnamed protein product [Darwinula stevensoni]CAG0894711.1 unnamed protein product [Darwinula stevensoni]
MESEEKGPASNGVSMTPSAKETFFHRLYRDVPLVQTLWGKGCEIHKKAEERLPGYAWIVSGPVHDAAVSVSANLMHIPKVGEYDENGASGTWSTLLSALSQLSQPALLYYSKWMRLARRKVRTMRRMGRPGAEFEDAQESPTSKRLTWPVQALQEIFLAPLYLLGLKGREKEEIPLVPVHGDGGSPNRPVDAERTREDGREGERLDEEALDEEERLDEEALDEEERLDEEALDEETPDEEDEVVDPDYVRPFGCSLQKYRATPNRKKPQSKKQTKADDPSRRIGLSPTTEVRPLTTVRPLATVRSLTTVRPPTKEVRLLPLPNS